MHKGQKKRQRSSPQLRCPPRASYCAFPFTNNYNRKSFDVGPTGAFPLCFSGINYEYHPLHQLLFGRHLIYLVHYNLSIKTSKADLRDAFSEGDVKRISPSRLLRQPQNGHLGILVYTPEQRGCLVHTRLPLSTNMCDFMVKQMVVVCSAGQRRTNAVVTAAFTVRCFVFMTWYCTIKRCYANVLVVVSRILWVTTQLPLLVATRLPPVVTGGTCGITVFCNALVVNITLIAQTLRSIIEFFAFHL